MNESFFKLEYDGPSIVAGRMDVRDLAPALLAVADLTREANRLAFPRAPDVKLEIRAQDRGSFIVELALIQPELVEQVITWLSSDDAVAVDRLKYWIFGGGGVSLLGLIKWLRRRRIARREQADNNAVRIIAEDGTTIEVPSQVVALYDNLSIRRRAKQVVEPLSKKGIDAVRFVEDENVALEITSGDVDAFDVEEHEQALIDHETEMVAAITSVTFVEDNKWRLSDGERTFYAAMEDSAFLERVDAGEPFRKGDMLHCRMHIRQARTESGLSTEYTVTEVLNHIPAATPIELPFDNEETNGAV